MLVKVRGNDINTIMETLVKTRTLPQVLYKSLTWDRGERDGAQAWVTVINNRYVFYCDSQSLWQC